jgi:transcriptional regulator with XRE-family HTH domain
MLVHIGKIIKKAVKKKGISVTDFADKVNYSRRNVYEIFDRETIDTSLLLKINKVLEENLFIHYISDNDIENLKNFKSNPEELKGILKDLRAEIVKLQEINSLPKKRVLNSKPIAKKI